MVTDFFLLLREGLIEGLQLVFLTLYSHLLLPKQLLLLSGHHVLELKLPGGREGGKEKGGRGMEREGEGRGRGVG